MVEVRLYELIRGQMYSTSTVYGRPSNHGTIGKVILREKVSQKYKVTFFSWHASRSRLSRTSLKYSRIWLISN